ncbi:MAG: S-layer protein [Firmicutes bacterium]|nr:S-layer protein [Bacillota bacterium]
MKKSLIVTLALVFVLGIVGTAFAATNPFVDVPAKHWAYGSISQLANAGIIDGYGDGTFRGDQLMTRYEMAQIVAKAMAKSDKADAANKATIDKLAVEFAAELNNLGVRVSKLEANASTIKFTGDARIRFQENWNVADVGGKRYQERIRLNMSSKLNDKVDFFGVLLMQNTTNVHSDVSASASGTDQTELSVAKFTFKNVASHADVSIGRDYLNQGATTLVAGTAGYYDSVKLTFGNVLSGWVAYGDVSSMPGPNTDNTLAATTDVMSAQLKWAPSKSTALFAFTQLGKSSNIGDYEMYGAGFSTKAGQFTIAADFAKNDGLEDLNTAWYASLWYKGANKAKPGSYGLFVDYRDIEAFSIATQISGLNIANPDTKGWGFGFNYTVAKNVVLTADVENLESSAFGTSHDDVYYFRTEYWF